MRWEKIKNLWILKNVLLVFSIAYSLLSNIYDQNITLYHLQNYLPKEHIEEIQQKKTEMIGIYDQNRVIEYSVLPTEEEADKRLLSQLVMAEAGNQDLTGKRFVADVVLNRRDDEKFPDSIKEIIFQEDQFSVIKNGSFEKWKDRVSEEAILAVEMEFEERLDSEILYFNSGEVALNGQNPWKYGDHWFGY